jgi:hypothetical protein
MPLFRGTAVEVALNDQSHPTALLRHQIERILVKVSREDVGSQKGRQLKASVQGDHSL